MRAGFMKPRPVTSTPPIGRGDAALGKDILMRKYKITYNENFISNSNGPIAY
jgi:hypothetical protein